jgi:predicted dehydrogenase
VSAVVSATPERATTIAGKYGIDGATTDYREALDADAVCIATSPDLHREIALAAFASGCHVLCEKPLGASTADCEAMLEAGLSSGLVHAVNYDWRFVPALATLHARLTEGWTGDVEHVHVAWLAPWEADRAGRFTWRHELARCGAGVLGDQSHLLDDVLWNLGPMARVCADLATVVPERRDDRGAMRCCDAEDTAAFVALTRERVPVTGQCSRCAIGGLRWAEYRGSLGTLTFRMSDPSDRGTATLVGRRHGEPEVDLSPATAAPETAQARFVAAIRGGIEPSTSFADGLAVVRLTDALRESSEHRRWVDIDSN